MSGNIHHRVRLVRLMRKWLKPHCYNKDSINFLIRKIKPTYFCNF